MLITRGFTDFTLVVRGMTRTVCKEWVYREVVDFISKTKSSIYFETELIDGEGNCMFKRKYQRRGR
jgi:hypothetical protein